jgi:hypothetical protein
VVIYSNSITRGVSLVNYYTRVVISKMFTIWVVYMHIMRLACPDKVLCFSVTLSDKPYVTLPAVASCS